MFKRSSVLTLGLRELFFDCKLESNVAHYKFNTRKALAFTLLIASLTLNVIMLKKCGRLMTIHLESLESYSELKQDHIELRNAFSDMLEQYPEDNIYDKALSEVKNKH